MFRLHKLNIVKLVDSEHKKDRLIEQGFVEMQVPELSVKDESETDLTYSSMNYHELKTLAGEKGIKTYKLKKEELILALKESEE